MQLGRLFKSETIAESAGIVLVFTIVRQILQTGRGIVFARFLGPSEYGVYTLAFFFIPLIAAIARLGIPSSFSRYVPQYEKKAMLRDFLSKTYLMALGASTFLMFLCLFVPVKISMLIYGSPDYKLVIIICSLSILPLSLQECLAQTFNGMRVFKLSYSLVFVQFMIFTLLGILLVLTFQNAEVAVFSNLVSLILVAILFGILLMKYISRLDSQIRKIKEVNFHKKIFRYSVWFVISPIVFSLFRYVDRWMLNYFLGLEEVGVYSVAMNVTGLLFAFGMVIGNVLMPTLSNLWEEGLKEKALSILDFSVRVNTILLLGGALLIMLFKNPIINILYGREYASSTALIGVLLVFWLLNTIYWTMGGYTGLVEKTYIPLVCNLSGLLCNVILNYLFIPRFGISGAAAATTIAFGLALFMIAAWAWRIGFRLKINTIFVCLVPCVFLLKGFVVAIVYVVLMAVLFTSELLMTRKERADLISKFSEWIRKYLRKPRKAS